MKLLHVSSLLMDASKTSEAMDILLEISKILDANLDAETLSVCVELCELGVNPEALASVIKEIRSQTANLKAQES